jgi:hypothetical protein
MIRLRCPQNDAVGPAGQEVDLAVPVDPQGLADLLLADLTRADPADHLPEGHLLMVDRRPTQADLLLADLAADRVDQAVPADLADRHPSR